MTLLLAALAAVTPLAQLESIHVQPPGCPSRPYHRYQRAYDEYEADRGLETRIVRSMGGRIYSPYDGRTYASITDTDIEHIVSREEAHVSGLCHAPRATKVAFVTDLGNLTLATPQVNRAQKGSKDAAKWQPIRNRCWFVARVVDVKYTWGLSVDEAEYHALRDALDECHSFTLDAPQE